MFVRVKANAKNIDELNDGMAMKENFQQKGENLTKDQKTNIKRPATTMAGKRNLMSSVENISLRKNVQAGIRSSGFFLSKEE